jgi:hypothetical protein
VRRGGETDLKIEFSEWRQHGADRLVNWRKNTVRLRIEILKVSVAIVCVGFGEDNEGGD